MPSSQSSSEVDSNEVLNRLLSPGHISSGFKLHCLRTTLAFVKNDNTATKEFPELKLEQAQFMHLLLESVIAFTQFDNNLEIKELYRALWEAVRIYSLKYEFRIKCAESSGGKNSLVFEKVPKQKPPVTAVNLHQIMNPKTDGLKTVASKPETPKPEGPKPAGVKPEAQKTEASKLEVSKTAALKPEAPKTEAVKPQASKPEASNSKPWFPMPVIPKCTPCVNQNSTRITKRMLNSRLKMENENLFIKRLPSKFISDTLNTIHKFLLDEDRLQLVFVPNSHAELDFYSNCLSWCRTTFDVSKFGDEFQEVHHKISSLLFHVNYTVNRGSSNKINETTGIKEVSYIKARKNVPVGSIPEPAQSAPKKKKVNLQNALQLSGTDNIKLESVVNLNQSLRSKKKNKKLKKAKLKAASKEGTVKPPNQAKTWTDGSSSTCSSRGTSRDRSKVAAQAQNVAKRALNETNQSVKNTFKETSRSWRGEESIRKEQLIEALSVPVQSDKAMRMMRGMGWSGGALGARGNGITEPLMPTLDRARGAGLGHSRNAQSETTAMKPRESKTGPAFVSENSETDKAETDVIVQKTKRLLLENPTLDTIMNAMEPQKQNKNNIELPRQTKPLPTQTKYTVEVSKAINANLEPPKLRLHFRQEILHSILGLLNSDATSKTLNYEKIIRKKDREFLINALKALRSRNNYGMFRKEEHELCGQIYDKYNKLPQVVFETLFSNDFKTVELKKKGLSEVETPVQQESSVKANTEIISEANILSYITSSGTKFESQKAYAALKFKVLFLLNILSFVKSLNEEVEISFNRVLNLKQKSYIQNVIDEVNMRIKFGSSPAEINLCAEIKSHDKGAFLSSMFNHQYTVVTLNKYFRFKRLNRPDNVVKRTSQTTVNLDAFSSETYSEPKLNTQYQPTVKENNSKYAGNNSTLLENNNKAAKNNSAYVVYENNAVALPEKPEANEFDHYDSDISNDEENNNNCTVPKLPPGEEGVNISNLLCLYDKLKTNTAGIENNSNINNDSACKYNSNETVNRNKNNIDNGNVVVDKKRDYRNTEENYIVDTEMVECVVCVDYTEEAVNSGEMTVDINKEKEVNITEDKKYGEEIDQPIKHSNVVLANDVVEIVNQHKKIGIDNIEKVVSNTEDTIDKNLIVIEDSDLNYCTETIVKEEIRNGDNPCTNQKDIKEDTDVIMVEIDDEPMEVISIIEKSIEVIDKEDLVKVINKEASMEIIDQGESMEEMNKVEIPKDVKVIKMEEENSINLSDDQIVRGDLEITTDSDIISKEKLVLSKDVCDTHSLGLSYVKALGTETDKQNIHFNKDREIKTVRFVHTNHPIKKLTNEEVEEIQRHISNSILLATQLPLLKCHGVQNGALIYNCHNKKTYDWLQNIVSVASYVKVLNTEVTKMALKLYCFFDFDTKHFFRMIELYNQELSTKDWVVEKTLKGSDYVIVIVKMDKFSIKFIQESDLALFAGIDKVQFSLIWE